MLLISDASSIVFLKFLQIFLWISIPAFLIGILITTITHYRNKRKKIKKPGHLSLFGENGSSKEHDDISLSPLNLQESNYEGRKIMDYLSFSNARYIAIQKDFKMLTEKYLQLQVNINQNSETKKYETMDTIKTDLQPISFEQIAIIKQEHENEKKELLAELAQLTTSFENLEKDNNNLREQLNVYCENGTGFASILQKWEDEKAELKSRINEQEYLKDVLDEKKQQIAFLQQQMEQRIRNHHLVEQQFRDLGMKFMDVNEKLEINQQSIKEFQATLHDKEQEIIFLKEVVQSETVTVTKLEKNIKELQEQHSKLCSDLEGKNKLVGDMQSQLAEINEVKIKLEERLERSQTFIKGFHRKLSDILQEEIPESPVIVMKPLYKQENTEQQLTELAIP